MPASADHRADAAFVDFLLPLGLNGVGSALLWIPLSVAVLSSTTPREGPKAAAFVQLALQLGGSISVAALAVILHGRECVFIRTSSAAC